MEQTESHHRGVELGDGLKKVEGLVQQHICIIHRHRPQSGGGPREEGTGAGWGSTKWGKWGYL